MDFKKLREDVLSQSQLDGLPSELRPATIFTWDLDIDLQRDWLQFIQGIKVGHTYFDGNGHKVMLDTTSMEYGSETGSLEFAIKNNETISFYSTKHIEFDGKVASIGSDIHTKYMIISQAIDGIDLKGDKKKVWVSKIILVNLAKYLSRAKDEDKEIIINYMNGKFGETIEVPYFKDAPKHQTYDPNITKWEKLQITNDTPVLVETYFDKTLLQLGGTSFIKNDDFIKVKGKPKRSKDREITIKKANTKPEHFEQNEFYSIVPAQFKIPSIDNYGFTHPNDPANAIKTLLATQALGQAQETAQATADNESGGLADLGGLISKGLGSVFGSIGNSKLGQLISSKGASTSVGLAQKYFGDKGTLANSGAVIPTISSNPADPIKFFIQPQGMGEENETNYVYNGVLDLQKGDNDYLEVNQSNGEFGNIGKAMSPSRNGEFDKHNFYRALGARTIKGKTTTIPALATPFGDFKIDDTKIGDYLKFGIPRLNVATPFPAPVPRMDEWDYYVRKMFFRPDPYSFWNFPLISPSVVSIFTDSKKTSIHYDTTVIPSVLTHAMEFLGGKPTENPNDGQSLSGHWNKTITGNDIVSDNFNGDDFFSSFRYEFEENGNLEIPYKSQMLGFTTSTCEYKFINKKGEVIANFKMNTSGRISNNPFDWYTEHTF